MTVIYFIWFNVGVISAESPVESCSLMNNLLNGSNVMIFSPMAITSFSLLSCSLLGSPLHSVTSIIDLNSKDQIAQDRKLIRNTNLLKETVAVHPAVYVSGSPPNAFTGFTELIEYIMLKLISSSV